MSFKERSARNQYQIAQLYFAANVKAAINLEDGNLAEANFQRVPYLRVRKQFSKRPVASKPSDLHRQDDATIVEKIPFW
jgi:hypothetical protein